MFPPNMFRGFDLRGKVRLTFSQRKDIMKRKCYVFSKYKQRNKVCVVYLECKLQKIGTLNAFSS